MIVLLGLLYLPVQLLKYITSIYFTYTLFLFACITFFSGKTEAGEKQMEYTEMPKIRFYKVETSKQEAFVSSH